MLGAKLFQHRTRGAKLKAIQLHAATDVKHSTRSCSLRVQVKEGLQDFNTNFDGLGHDELLALYDLYRQVRIRVPTPYR